MPGNRGSSRSRETTGLTYAQFEKMALALPAVEAGTSYGTPALKVKKKFMARLRDDDPDVLVLKHVYDDEQRFLMETQPDVFFKTDHYRGWPGILIRLSKVDRAAARRAARSIVAPSRNAEAARRAGWRRCAPFEARGTATSSAKGGAWDSMKTRP